MTVDTVHTSIIANVIRGGKLDDYSGFNHPDECFW